MKKTLIFALALLALFCAHAEKAYGKLDDKPIFSVEYDGKAFKMDDTVYSDENAADFRFHFLLQNELNDVISCMEYVPEYRDFSSYLATEAELSEYAAGFDGSDAGFTYEFVEIYRVKVRNGACEAVLPFVIMKVDDREEHMDSYYAETVSHGWAVYIEVYNNVRDTVDEADLRLLKSILDAFTPISDGK